MKIITADITITSKNQITLPSQFVRQLKLQKNRVLSAELSGDTIRLIPKPSVESVMKKYWSKNAAVKPLSEAELKQAIRAAGVSR